MRSTLPVWVAAVFIVSLSGASAAEVSEIAGDWDLAMTSPVGEHSLKVSFKVDGTKLTGLVKGEASMFSPAYEKSLEGTIAGKDITFVFTEPSQGVTLTFSGTVDAETMRGKVDYGGMAGGEWSAKRSTASGKPDTTAAGPAL